MQKTNKQKILKTHTILQLTTEIRVEIYKLEIKEYVNVMMGIKCRRR